MQTQIEHFQLTGIQPPLQVFVCFFADYLPDDLVDMGEAGAVNIPARLACSWDSIFS
jgi:hypothetical protein